MDGRGWALAVNDVNPVNTVNAVQKSIADGGVTTKLANLSNQAALWR
ncbi:MAG: hypothetical protein ACKO8U_13855 [Pirellula sp.]